MRNHDFMGCIPLGLKPGDHVPLQDIVYLIYWCTTGIEQLRHQIHFDCMTPYGVLNCLCRISVEELPF